MRAEARERRVTEGIAFVKTVRVVLRAQRQRNMTPSGFGGKGGS